MNKFSFHITKIIFITAEPDCNLPLLEKKNLTFASFMYKTVDFY